MRYRVLTLFASLLLLVSSSTYAQENPHLVVAWLADNNVMVWHEGDAAPTTHAAPEDVAANARELLISSDGQYVAVNATFPGRLWLATPTDADLVELVPNQALPATDDQKFQNIANLQRGMNSRFYFNTIAAPSHYTLQNNDLWTVDAASRTIKLLIPTTQGGPFNLSPDKEHIAIVQSGTYGAVDGKISLIDKEGQSLQEMMTFSAVSSGSENDFVLPTFWQADNTAFNVAIPHKDLIYNDNTAPTTLWHIGVDGSKTQLGTVQATLFGLPKWSDDGKQTIYLRRVGNISTNQFELMLASGDGSNSTTYANGTAGTIGLPQWLPNSDQFIYSQGEPGDYWLGQAGKPAQALPGKIFNPHFVDSTTYVFINADGELRYAHLGDSSSTLIAGVNNTSTLFDAHL
jgi:hypothetical protein